ncbi:uncharacterized protein PpBr36_09637 [Pyricularia pennisetigena]|uniref:uncharacterized protein n=1 Tax=Pyricularia pennisetigena TaxID=1578925 RepID=UPI00115383EF|nr:uncharacterized protein PpBr36_09637 [Pyricularia pennisetigena]TLS22006.1 hypothetical protein PpBr36_09637 [Pyricularia pennisetigena]
MISGPLSSASVGECGSIAMSPAIAPQEGGQQTGDGDEKHCVGDLRKQAKSGLEFFRCDSPEAHRFGISASAGGPSHHGCNNNND